MKQFIQDNKVTIVVVILISTLVISLITYLKINEPDKLNEITLNTKVDTNKEKSKTEDKNLDTDNKNTNEYGKEDMQYKEYEDAGENEKGLKEYNGMTGNIIEQPIEIEDEQPINEDLLSEIDEDSEISNSSEDIEIKYNSDDYKDELLNKPVESLIYEVRKYVEEDIKNMSYIAVMTNIKNEEDFKKIKGYNYSVLLNKAKISVRYVDYYDKLIKNKCIGLDDINKAWGKIKEDIKKLDKALKNIDNISDMIKSKELKNINIIKTSNEFTSIANKYLIDYDHYKVDTDIEGIVENADEQEEVEGQESKELNEEVSDYEGQ